MQNVRCPECGSSNIKTLRMIYEFGTRTHESSFTRSNSFFDGTSHGTSQSYLAADAAPPRPPRTGFLLSLIMAGVIGSTVLYVGYTLAERVTFALGFPILMLIAGVMAIVISSLFFVVSLEQHKEATRAYERAVQPKESCEQIALEFGNSLFGGIVDCEA